MTERPGDYTPGEIRRELYGDGPALGSAVDQLEQQIGSDIADIIRGTFDAFGFAYHSNEVRAEIARQCRLKSKTGA
jgi:hypothetical protein